MLDFHRLKIYRIILLTAIAIAPTRWHLNQSNQWAMATTNNFALDLGTIANDGLVSDRYLISSLSLNPQQIDPLEQLVFEEVNQYRASLNLAPLRLSPQISEQAKIHSANMANESAPFSHDGFKLRIEAIKNHISYRSAAENLAYNMGYNDPVRQAVAGWIESPTHRQNMAGNYNLTGIGVAKNHHGEYYFTQIFILEP